MSTNHNPRLRALVCLHLITLFAFNVFLLCQERSERGMVPGWPRIVWQQKPLRVWHARGIHQCGQLHGVDQSEPEGMKTQKSSDDMKRGRQAPYVNLGLSLKDI